MSFFSRSPMRSHRLEGDVENPNPPHSDSDSDDESNDVFTIHHKTAPLESLKRWRNATLVLNASRRFRYTLDLKRQEQNQVNKIRASTHALVAVQRFKEAASKSSFDRLPPDGFGVAPERLVKLLQDRNVHGLQALGGIDGLAKALRTDLENGITDGEDDIHRRKEAFGANTYPQKPGKSFWKFIWDAIRDTTLIILLVCAVLSLIVEMSIPKNRDEGWYDGTSIGCAVLIVVLVTACSDYKQNLQFRSLSNEKRNIQLNVVRKGRRFSTSIFDLLVGDIVPLNIGDQVPADGVFVQGHSLTIDESSMTGESIPVHVDAKNPFLMSGCKIVDGFGTMMVTGVGINTEWGQVMATLEDDTTAETPLQVRLNGVATFIGKIGLGVAGLVFVILFIKYFAITFRKASKADRKPATVMSYIVDILSIAVTIIVVAVPEGLPLAVTLTLAYSMKKMMADKALVRHLAACETMGSATTICSDKTGTLTLNQMTAVSAWVAGELTNGAWSYGGELRQALIEGAALNSSGSVYMPKDEKEPEVTGSPTEKAILSWGLQLGMDFVELRAACRILHVETFNSTKKRAGVAFKRPSGDAFVHWKGAAEIIVDLCTGWAAKDGTVNPLTQETKEEIMKAISDMAASSLRCVALAYRPVAADEIPKEEEWETWQIPEEKLILTAIVGIKDPCRPGVSEAVATCQRGGLKIRMVTGDNALTARAIAKECGILTENGVVIEGKEFRNLSDHQRMDLVPKLDVMARSSPMDKLLLVRTLKQLGDVVGVTGDGTNDAPALHEADIGLSMGISGTEVAKESSDIIILDDNFASVVKVVLWGRSVRANIQKFIQFQLTVNVVALAMNFIAAIASDAGGVPLKAVQLLWVNLIMDTLGALALATERPTPDLMERPPVGRKEPLVTNIMWRNIFVQSGYQLAVLLVLFFGGERILGLKGTHDQKLLVLNSIIFNAFVWCQLFNEINSRKPDHVNVFSGVFTNWLFCSVIVVTAILQVLIIEFIKKFFKVTALSWQHWLICVVIGVISLPLAAIGKLLPVPEKPFFEKPAWMRRKHRRRGTSSRHQDVSEQQQQ